MNRLIIATLASTMAFAVPAIAQDIHHTDFNEMRDAQYGRGPVARHEEHREVAEHHERREEHHKMAHHRHARKRHARHQQMHHEGMAQ